MCSESILSESHAVKCELAADVLRTHGKLRLQVSGWSMFPAIRPGDTLIVDRITSSGTSEGNIVLFSREQRLFAHRVVAKAGHDSGLLTRGDAMPAPDRPVSEAELLGKISFIVRNGRYIRPRKTLRVHERVVGALVHRSQVAARIVAGIHGLRQASQVQTA